MNEPVQASEIAAAVHAVLEDAVPQLQGRSSFDARVAMRLLDLVRRELEQGAQAQRLERAGLRILLGETEDEDALSTEQLRGRLCDRIARGPAGWDQPGLLDHLWQTTLAQLEIDNPRYRWRAEL